MVHQLKLLALKESIKRETYGRVSIVSEANKVDVKLPVNETLSNSLIGDYIERLISNMIQGCFQDIRNPWKFKVLVIVLHLKEKI